MSECQHIKVQRWFRTDTDPPEPVYLWACVECHRRFEPIQVTPAEDVLNKALKESEK